MEKLDIAVVSIIAVSALFAFIRGFTREILSIAAWVGAVAVAIYAGPMVQPTLDSFIPEAWRKVADSFHVGDILVFLVAVIFFSLIVGVISSQIKQTVLGPLDRTLGLLFGVARGVLIVCLVYLVGSHMVQADDQPDWVAKARSRPLLAAGAAEIEQLVPRSLIEKNLPGVLPAAKNAADKAGTAIKNGQAAEQLNDALDKLSEPPDPKPAQKPTDPNNPEAHSDSKGLEQLFQAQGGK